MAKKSDSIEHHEERHAKIRDEAAAQQATAVEAEEKRVLDQIERDRVIRKAENQELAQQVELVKQGDTREMLLERIRQQREKDKPAEEQPVFLSESHRKRVEVEQQAGREAVARAEAEVERSRELRRRQEEVDRARQGTMETVYHPNPSQDEVYPTSKSK